MLTLSYDSYFSSILGRITRVRREAIEQREKMLSLLPQTSPNFTMPSYARVATRNTRNTTIRSIHDTTKTDSATGRPEAKPNGSSDAARANSWKTEHSPVERKRNNHHSGLSASASEFKDHKNGSSRPIQTFLEREQLRKERKFQEGETFQGQRKQKAVRQDKDRSRENAFVTVVGIPREGFRETESSPTAQSQNTFSETHAVGLGNVRAAKHQRRPVFEVRISY